MELIKQERSHKASPWDALALPPGWRCNKNHDDDKGVLGATCENFQEVKDATTELSSVRSHRSGESSLLCGKKHLSVVKKHLGGISKKK